MKRFVVNAGRTQQLVLILMQTHETLPLVRQSVWEGGRAKWHAG